MLSALIQWDRHSHVEFNTWNHSIFFSRYCCCSIHAASEQHKPIAEYTVQKPRTLRSMCMWPFVYVWTLNVWNESNRSCMLYVFHSKLCILLFLCSAKYTQNHNNTHWPEWKTFNFFWTNKILIDRKSVWSTSRITHRIVIEIHKPFKLKIALLIKAYKDLKSLFHIIVISDEHCHTLNLDTNPSQSFYLRFVFTEYWTLFQADKQTFRFNCTQLIWYRWNATRLGNPSR